MAPYSRLLAAEGLTAIVDHVFLSVDDTMAESTGGATSGHAGYLSLLPHGLRSNDDSERVERQENVYLWWSGQAFVAGPDASCLPE